jgi:glycine oxidase
VISTPVRVEAVVVGGGVIGLTIAWRLAQRNLQVTVADPHPGRSASWAAAGMLAPVSEVSYGEEALLVLNRNAAEIYPEFVAELEATTERSVGYRTTGSVLVARDADDNAALEDVLRFQLDLGLDVRRLRARELRALQPSLAPSVRGGILVEGDHQVDNRALVEALVVACRRAGVVFVPERAFPEVSDGAVVGVRSESGGEIGADWVVLAAGAWNGAMAGLPSDVVPPIRPVKGQLLHLRGPEQQPLLTMTVQGRDAYIVPRADGRVVVGATVEELGFDTRVTAGAVFSLLEAAHELVPGVSELELTEVAVGLRPGSPDNAPLLGRLPIEGAVVAGGHYRNGILLAPVTGAAVAELVATGETPAAIAPFSPQRFARHRVGA